VVAYPLTAGKFSLPDVHQSSTSPVTSLLLLSSVPGHRFTWTIRSPNFLTGYSFISDVHALPGSHRPQITSHSSHVHDRKAEKIRDQTQK
jgi:hypothetical protein